MDSGANSTNSAAESVAESPAPASPPSHPASVVTKGRGLRRWRRIAREHHDEGSPPGPVAAAGADEDWAQLHKRRLPLAANAPKGKQDPSAAEEESPVASVESSFVPPEAPPSPVQTKLDPDLGFLIASAGFSVGAGGADSDNSDDRISKSSTNAPASRALPRHDFSFAGFGRERDRPRPRAPGAGAHGKSIRPARARGASARASAGTVSTVEAENWRSSVESNLRSSSSGAAHARQSSAGISSNGVHKVLTMTLSTVTVNLPARRSIALLQSAEEALENEIRRFVEIRKETWEDSTNNHSETEWSSSCHFDDSAELSEELKLLESRLEEASVLINDKDSRIVELDALNHKQPSKPVLCNSELLSLRSDMDRLFLEKMEAETQCFILTRASQAWKPLTDDQADLPEDHKQLEAKVWHSEKRAMVLEEMVENLETQCKDLARTSEILKLQARASRASLFCSIQFVLLCIAVGTFLIRLLPSSEFVPT
ncbi:hypothetical protein GUJ93_ZPchr0009g387 [Zizania palustris]|uniref:Uncharacterized protein n=1 Tax=Zizania palustris TaxID=103762 RepID=A0A8J5RMD9_ZIZPA|nr:hypothetical protein GUJ93_ZPchr0009g387 [Zizania palustris]